MDSAILPAAQKLLFLALSGFEKKSFSLLWRGSRDGFDAAAFHRLCDGKANTVTVIKNTNGFIFGGFTSIPWSSSGGYTADSAAFLFSLTNPINTPLKLNVKSSKNAVYCHPLNYGPSFGGGHDLHVSSLSNINKNSYMKFHSYEFPHGMWSIEGGKFIVGGSDNKFQIIEIEVFQVS